MENKVARRVRSMKKPIPMKKTEVVDGYTIKFHANGKSRWSKGKIVDGKAEGYWEWYRLDGTLKRSGYFQNGEPTGDWTTHDKKGNEYKVERKKAIAKTEKDIRSRCSSDGSEIKNPTDD